MKLYKEKRSKNLLACATAAISILVSIKLHHCQDTQDQRSPKERLLVISAFERSTTSEKFARFNSTIEAFNLKLEPVQIDAKHQARVGSKDWHKIVRLKEAIERHKQERDLIILLVEGSDSLVNGDQVAILKRFNKLTLENGAPKLILSGDSICLPPNLEPKFERIFSSQAQSNPTRYLSSRALIGYAASVHELLELMVNNSLAHEHSKAVFDFQAQLVELYLNDTVRQQLLPMYLDYKSELFQSLSAHKAHAEDEIELAYDQTDLVKVKNLAQGTWPVVVHAGGLGRIALNSLGNYLGKAWTLGAGCRHCNSSKISLKALKDDHLPSVLVAVFIEQPTPFMSTFYESLKLLDYPQNKMHLFIHNSVAGHSQSVNEFLGIMGHKYASYELSDAEHQNRTTSPVSGGKLEWEARNYALERCQQLSCDYYLSLDSLVRLERPETLRDLIETNKTIVAPMLNRAHKLWSNFWAAIGDEGYYLRSHDYVDLVARQRVGVWNVPLVTNCYLIEGKFLRHWLREGRKRRKRRNSAHLEANISTTKQDNEENQILELNYYDWRFPNASAELIFGRNLRNGAKLDNAPSGLDNEAWQFVSNEQEFGHLIDATNYNLTRLHADIYELEHNPLDWQQVYLNEQYFDLFDERDELEGHEGRIRLESPCQDVYWFPLVSGQFCSQLIEIMENFGHWSTGNNDDPRIEGGYESVPTRDIHFRQVGLHQMWLYFLRQFVMPIQMKEYIGYEHDPPRTDLAFVVRYNPSEQPALRPHHDSSTYTINIALNSPGLDYEGGGCRFVRYNCSVTDSRRGWALIHPGRLTHYHEGLPVTRGTRYILVTFVDP